MKKTKASERKSKAKSRAKIDRKASDSRSAARLDARQSAARPVTKEAHAEAVIRLRRVRGHLDKVIQMIETGSPCTDILQQLSAVLSAIGGCRTLLFSGHLKTCLRPALKNGNEMLIDEIEKLASRVMRVN